MGVTHSGADCAITGRNLRRVGMAAALPIILVMAVRNASGPGTHGMASRCAVGRCSFCWYCSFRAWPAIFKNGA